MHLLQQPENFWLIESCFKINWNKANHLLYFQFNIFSKWFLLFSISFSGKFNRRFLILIFMGLLCALDSWWWSKLYPRLKFQPKVLETSSFAPSIPYFSSFQKYLSSMLCQQIFCWCQHFLVKNFQNLMKIGPFWNCYIEATNKGKKNIDPSLQSTEIGFYICNNILCHLTTFSCWRLHFLKSKF